MKKQVSYKNGLDQAVMSTLLYFDVFHFPLTVDEVTTYLSIKAKAQEVMIALQGLVDAEMVTHHDGYYSPGDAEKLSILRLESSRRADSIMPLAQRMGQRIARFPYVKAVFLSGSISKHVMHENSDIDFFIVARQGRLWVAKLFLKLYKMLFLANRKRHFCMNYFISDGNLEINEQSIFTAIELSTLIPVNDPMVKERLLTENQWAFNVLPNYRTKPPSVHDTQQKAIWARGVERAFRGRIGTALDRMVMNYVSNRNEKRYLHLQKDEDFELMTRATPNQGKVHTSNHHRTILNRYHQKLEKYELAHKYVSL